MFGSSHGLHNEMLSRASWLWTCFERFAAFYLGTMTKKLEAS
jgi:hypothetical protein